jgi:hypothetical protein
MLPTRRLTGATCQGRPHCRLLAVQKCRRRNSRKWPCMTRPWARARVRRLAPPERTSGRSALVWRPAGREPPSRRDPRLAKPTLREGRRSGRRPLTSFTMAPTTPTPIPCRGADRGESRRTRRRRRAHRRRQSQALPRGVCSHCLSKSGGPGCSRVPHRQRGPQSNPDRRGGQGVSPRAGGGEVLLLSRQRTEAELPLSWRAQSAQPSTWVRPTTR